MTLASSLLRHLRFGALAAGVAWLPLVAVAADGAAVDLGQQVPDPQTINEGLFPEDACKELEQAGFTCMGFKPAARFSLPTAPFEVGSARLRQQPPRDGAVRIQVLEGRLDRADTSGWFEQLPVPTSTARASSARPASAACWPATACSAAAAR